MKADKEKLPTRGSRIKLVEMGDYLTQKQYLMIAVVFGVTHIFLELLYIALGCLPMALINILSFLCYVVSVIIILKGNPFITVWIMETEVFWHVVLATLFLGLDCGYHLWLFGTFSSVFLPYSIPELTKKNKAQIAFFGVVIVIAFEALTILDKFNMFPTYYRVEPPTSTIMYYVNAAVGFASIMVYTSFYNRRMADKNDALRVAANHDFLTGIYNRQRIQTMLSGEVDRALEDDSFMLAVAILDIDFFKKINDAYGHKAGDDVLKQVAQIFSETEDQGLLYGRWGGEEFLLISPENISYYQFGEMLEDLRKRIEDHKFTSGKHTIKATVSIGAAAYEKRMTAEKLVHIADDRLYEAKQSGRNRVIYK